MKKTLIIIIALLLSNGHVLFAQSNLLDLGRIKDQSFTQKTMILESDGRIGQVGTMTTIIKVDKKNNFLYQIRTTSGGRKDSTVCRLSDMKPIYFSTKGEGMNQIHEYLLDKVNTYVDINGEKVSKGAFEVSSDSYDYFMDSYIVSLLPLRDGFKGSFYVFSGFVNKQLVFEVLNVTKDFIYNSQQKYIPAYLAVCENAGVKLNMWFDESNNELVRFIACLPSGKAIVRDLVYEKQIVKENEKLAAKEEFRFEVYNRDLEMVVEKEKEFIRFSENKGPGLAWIKGKEFSEGTIEFDARGRDVLQKSFLGVAFHGEDNNTYETVYFRPFNFQASDPIRQLHSVQYTFEPKFTFQVLRDTRKDEFEAAIKPSTVQATDWFHVRLVVKDGRIKVFVNHSVDACLDVPTLNPTRKGGKIGFFVGNNSNGDFDKLAISDQ